MANIAEWKEITSGQLSPILFVRYHRVYFGDTSGNRATIDSDIRYCLVAGDWTLKELFIPTFSAIDPECVLEIKLTNAEGIDRFSNNLPHTARRFSKYCQGIALLTGRIH